MTHSPAGDRVRSSADRTQRPRRPFNLAGIPIDSGRLGSGNASSRGSGANPAARPARDRLGTDRDTLRAVAGAGHRQRVQREFGRQAESFAASHALAGPDLVERLVLALGAAGEGRVLDWACGPGLVSTALAPRAREVLALDLTDGVLRVAARRVLEAGCGNVRLVRGDGLRLPLPDACLDAATLRLAVHHLESPGDALREVRRCLCPAGVVAVLDLLAPEDADDDRVLLALERLRDPSHVRALRATELVDLVRDAGFVAVASETFRLERRFSEWAAIIADPVRTDALRVVMRELARCGVRAGIGLREASDDLCFDYRFALVVGRRA